MLMEYLENIALRFKWKKGSQTNQYIMTAFITYPTLATGMASAWLSPIITQLQSPNGPLKTPLSNKQLGLFAAVPYLTSAPIQLMGGFLADKIGRKKCLLLASFTFLIYWALKLTWFDTEVILVARAIAGIGDGLSYIIPPIYIKEISDDNIRGALGSTVLLSQNIGYTLMYIIGDAFSIRTVMWIAFTLTMCHFIIFWFAPENPHYLIKKGKTDKATQVYAWLHSNSVTDVDTQVGIGMIANEQQIGKPEGKIGPWSSLVGDRTNLKAFFIAAVLAVGIESTGPLALMIFAGDIFHEAHSALLLTPNQQSIVLGLVNICASFCAISLMDKVNRKPVIIISSLLVGLGMLTLGVWFYYHERGRTIGAGLPVVIACITIFSNSSGQGPAAFVIITEMFTFKLRAVASSLCVTLISASDFFLTWTVPNAKTVIGYHGLFWIYSGICVLVALFTLIVLPETRKRTSIEIYERIKIGKKRNRDNIDESKNRSNAGEGSNDIAGVSPEMKSKESKKEREAKKKLIDGTDM